MVGKTQRRTNHLDNEFAGSDRLRASAGPKIGVLQIYATIPDLRRCVISGTVANYEYAFAWSFKQDGTAELGKTQRRTNHLDNEFAGSDRLRASAGPKIGVLQITCSATIPDLRRCVISGTVANYEYAFAWSFKQDGTAETHKSSG
jgi:hypothetical protein